MVFDGVNGYSWGRRYVMGVGMGTKVLNRRLKFLPLPVTGDHLLLTPHTSIMQFLMFYPAGMQP